MGESDKIGGHLSSEVAAATKQQMQRLLSDTFRLMFNLDVASARNPLSEQTKSISAHMVLSHEEITACISIRILPSTASLIAERVGMGSSPVPPSVLQDIACEIVNIVGNNLRTFLTENLGIYFEITNVVEDGAELGDLKASIIFNLDFEINPEKLLSLGFICGDESKPKLP